MTGTKLLQLSDLVVARQDTGGTSFRILDVPALDVAPGAIIGVGGPSGAGKSTLLDVIAGIVAPTSGLVKWGEDAVSNFDEATRDHWRRNTIGIVFQEFHLIPELSVEQNVLLPKRFAGFRLDPADRTRARDLIDRVGLSDPGRRASLLSRGEQQRVAIARALIAAPALLLADEPTASLDAATGRQVADLLLAQAHRIGSTLIVVTHDPALLERTDRQLKFVAGKLQGAAP